jgi:hypothetical protein
MHFVCYYYDRNPEKSTYYKDCALKLENQLKEFGYNTSFDNINFKERGLNDTYLKLNMFKPRYILDKQNQLNDSVIWIDADCYINQKPEEFDNLNCDIAYCIREHDGKTPHAAFLFFNNTEKSRKFLFNWELMNRAREKDHTYDCSEHCTLIESLEKADHNLRIIEFRDYARCGSYNRHGLNKTKIWIGISPDAWDYERNKGR